MFTDKPNSASQYVSFLEQPFIFFWSYKSHPFLLYNFMLALSLILPNCQTNVLKVFVKVFSAWVRHINYFISSLTLN